MPEMKRYNLISSGLLRHYLYIINNGALPEYKLDFGANWIDEEYLYNKKLNPATFFQQLEKSNSIYLLNTIESINHIFIYFMYKGDHYAYLYDKQSKRGVFITNYMKNGCGYNGLPIIPDGDSFVGVVNPYELSNINENKYQITGFSDKQQRNL